jgi:hypothetical protein
MDNQMELQIDVPITKHIETETSIGIEKISFKHKSYLKTHKENHIANHFKR